MDISIYQKTVHKFEVILKDKKLNITLHTWISTMATFLHLYLADQLLDKPLQCSWMSTSELAAMAVGKGPWVAWHVREWVQ
jgi:hypothetical protein